jgi:parallel beta-helix repeat protein
VIGGGCIGIGSQDPCGEAPWGFLPDTVEVGTIRYVWAGFAGDDSDGTRLKPFRTIQSALDVAAKFDTIAIGASDAGDVYDEGLNLTRSLRVRGRCSEKVTIAGVVPQTAYPGMTAGIYSLNNGYIELSGLTVTGPGSGILIYGKEGHRLTNLRVKGNQGNGILILFAKAVELSFSEVSGNLEGAKPNWGEGIHVEGSTGVTIESCSVAGNAVHGILALDGSEVSIRNTLVSKTVPGPKGKKGFGITASDLTSATIDSCTVSDNTEMGVIVDSGSKLAMSRTRISGTLAGTTDGSAHGLDVRFGAEAEVDRCALEENVFGGIAMEDAALTLRGSIVRDTRPTKGNQDGRGLNIQGGSSVTAEGSSFVRNADSGVMVVGSALVLRRCVIRDTQPDAAGEFGRGLQVQEGAEASVEGTLIAGSHDVGIMVSQAGLTLTDSVVRDTVPDRNLTEGRGIELYHATRADVFTSLIEGNTEEGLHAAASRLSITDSIVSGTRSGPTGDFGRGIVVTKDSEAALVRVLVRDNRDIGIHASDSSLTLSDSMVRDTGPALLPDGGGWGLDLEAAQVVVERSIVDSNTQLGVRALAATRLTLTGSVIRNTRSYDDGSWGHGLHVIGKADVTVSGSVFEGNREEGIILGDSILRMSDSAVRLTHSSTFNGAGPGLEILAGGNAVVTASVFAGDTGQGVRASEGRLDLSDSLIDGIEPDADGFWGIGIGCEGGLTGATLRVAGNLIRGSRASGVNLLGCTGEIVGNAIHGVGYSKGKWQQADGTVVELLDGTADGIVAVNSWDVVVSDNLVRDAKRAGIVFDASSGTIRANEVTGSDLFCAVFQNVTGDLALEDNRFRHADGTVCEPTNGPEEAVPVNNTAVEVPQMLGDGTEVASNPL